LSYLRSFPFDKIRSTARSSTIWRSGRLHGDHHAVVGLGASLGILTTAEGVETEEAA